MKHTLFLWSWKHKCWTRENVGVLSGWPGVAGSGLASRARVHKPLQVRAGVSEQKNVPGQCGGWSYQAGCRPTWSWLTLFSSSACFLFLFFSLCLSSLSQKSVVWNPALTNLEVWVKLHGKGTKLRSFCSSARCFCLLHRLLSSFIGCAHKSSVNLVSMHLFFMNTGV